MKKIILILMMAASVWLSSAGRSSKDFTCASNSAANVYFQQVVGSKDDTNGHVSLLGLSKEIRSKTDGMSTNTSSLLIISTNNERIADAMLDIATNNLNTLTNDVVTIDAISDIVTNNLNTLTNDIVTIDAISDITTNNLNTLTNDVVAIDAIVDSATNSLNTIDSKVDIITNITAGVVSNASFSYLDAGATQAIVTITTSSKIFIHGIFVDCNTLTQNGVLGLQVKVDGSNYREVTKIAFTVASDDSMYLIVNMTVDQDFQFTWTEGGDEGAARALPYLLSYEARE